MGRSFWERDPQDVARSLAGFALRIGDKEAVILHAAPYGRDEQERGLYRPMLSMDAGDVYCPKLMASILLLITTGKGKTLGSCVRIDDIELLGIRYEGPGRVTNALGIVTAKAKGVAQIVDDLCVEVNLDAHPLDDRPSGRRQKQKREQGLSNKVLARHMPEIAERYLAEDHPITFQEYVNLLLQGCNTEADLVKRIRS